MMHTKSLKKSRCKPDERHEKFLLDRHGECKGRFMIWARTTTLDTCGMHEGEPVFRPAICAWEAWKAAWNLTMPNEI
jgi:hypothetical protein